jgi:hypothetical protein
MAEPTISAKTTQNGEGVPGSQQRRPLAPSILSRPQKIATIILVGAIMLIGPASAGIYYPALGLLARDFAVSYSEISLTVTAYLYVSHGL